MKKLLFILTCAFFAISASADVSTVYVNPIQNQAGTDAVIAKRLYKKALLGLTKAKTIATASGPKTINPGSSDAAKYDYILDIILTDASITEAGTINNLLGVLGSSSAQKSPDWQGKLTTDMILRDAKTGGEAFKTTLAPTSTNKDKNLALFNATNNFDYDVTDMTDDAFRVCGEVVQSEVNKKNIVKKVRVQIGSKDGARRNQAFELFKVTDDNQELIGMAKCEQVLNADEAILSVNGKKDADQKMSDLIQNVDGTYTIHACSRSKAGFLHDNFQNIDKMFTNEGRPHYMDPFNRTSKPTVAFMAIDVNDDQFASQKELFTKTVAEGMRNVPTINFVDQIYPSADAARAAGIDGLIEISIDKVFKSTEQTKEGKTNYKAEILYTVSGMDVNNNKWIDMKSFHGIGESLEGAAKANADALSLMDTRVQKYSEDLFPVAASLIGPEEVKKNSMKKARINIGTAMGAKKGMKFDIYEQRKEGGADTRFLLGEGKIEKEGLTANEAILKIKGKNNGDERLFELDKNNDGSIVIVLVSKASYDIFDKGLNFFDRNK